MRNPLRPVRLGLLWLLAGVPLENHTAAIQRIDAGHQQQLARLQRPNLVQTFDVTVGSSSKGQALRYATRVASEHPRARVALIAASFDTGCAELVTGTGGLLSQLQLHHEARWNPAQGLLMLGNGSSFQVYGADKPTRLRGPQFHHAVAYDRANWPSETAEEASRNLKIAVRLTGSFDPPHTDEVDALSGAVEQAAHDLARSILGGGSVL